MPLVEYETQITRRLAGDPLDPYDYEQRLRLLAANTVGATSLSIDGWPAALLHGAWIVVDPYTSECEVRRVTGVSGTTLSFASALEYVHAEDDLVLLSLAGEINALWFGASPSATAAVNGVAFGRMVAQAKRNDNPVKMYVPGASDPYQFDTTIVLAGTGAIYGLSIRGDGMARRGEVYTHGTVLHYTATDASNAIEIGDGTNACRNLSLQDLTLRCDRAGGHTGCGILARYTGYTSDMLRNVAVTLAYVGIRTQDCWGSTWSNVDLSFCDLGASINGMNSGAWIGGGARSCYGEAAVKFGDAVVNENGNLVFRLADITFEGNTGDGIWFTRTIGVVAASTHANITIDNLYFEANSGTYDIKLGQGGGNAVRVQQCRIQNCRFEDALYIGDTVQNYVIGFNEFRGSSKIVLESASSSAHGVIFGGPSLITTVTNSSYGTTHRIAFIQPDVGMQVRGITGIASSYNSHFPLATPKVSSIEITAATAGWRDLAGATILKINHSGATNFTEITNCPDHTLLILKFQTGNTTVVHNASKIFLRGAANWTPAANDVLMVVSDGGVLYEVSRSQ